jgi:hypothetical protein
MAFPPFRPVYQVQSASTVPLKLNSKQFKVSC